MGGTPTEMNVSSTSQGASAEDCIITSDSRGSSNAASSRLTDARSPPRRSSTSNSEDRCSPCRENGHGSPGIGNFSSASECSNAARSKHGHARCLRTSTSIGDRAVRTSRNSKDALKTSSHRYICSATALHVQDSPTPVGGPEAAEVAPTDKPDTPATPMPVPALNRCPAVGGEDSRDRATSDFWSAFFAEETALGIVLLQKLQQQMRAEHLQEETTRSLSRATASSLPVWLNLRSILQTASAGAAVAAASAISSAPWSAQREYAADALSSQAPVFPKAQLSINASQPHASVPHMADSGAGDEKLLSGAVAAYSAACASSAGAAAPPAAGALMCVDKLTLRTVLLLLPVLAFKESEQLLRCGETVSDLRFHGRTRAPGYSWPRQLLGTGACDAMVRRLSCMLLHWRIFVSSSMQMHSRNSKCTDNTCSSHIYPYRTSSPRTGDALDSTFSYCITTGESISNIGNTSKGPNNASNGQWPPTSSNLDSDTTTKEIVCSFSNHVEAGCTCDDTAETFLVFVGKSLQQLLGQLLYAQALITAVGWGRQLHLHEQRRCPLELRSQTQAWILSKHAVKQLHSRQTEKPEERGTSQQCKAIQSHLQHLPSVLGSGCAKSHGRSLQQETQGLQQNEQGHRRETQRLLQRPQEHTQRPWREHWEEETLQECLQKLLLVLQRPRSSKEKDSVPLGGETLQGSQVQQQLILFYVVRLLSFCGVGSIVRYNLHQGSETTPATSAVRVGASIGQGLCAGDARKGQREPQRYCQQDMESDAQQHLPVCLRRSPLAAEPQPDTVAGTGCNIGVADRILCTGSSGWDTSSTVPDAVSMRLHLQLLLCDSQLYIHLATSPARFLEEQQCRRPMYSSIPPQAFDMQQVSQTGAQPGCPGGAMAQQYDCGAADADVFLRGVPSGEVTREKNPPAAAFVRSASCTPVNQEAVYSRHYEGEQASGEASEKETMPDPLPQKSSQESVLSADAIRGPHKISSQHGGSRSAQDRCGYRVAAHPSAVFSLSIRRAFANGPSSVCLRGSPWLSRSEEHSTSTSRLESTEATLCHCGEQLLKRDNGVTTCAAQEHAGDIETHHLGDGLVGHPSGTAGKMEIRDSVFHYVKHPQSSNASFRRSEALPEVLPPTMHVGTIMEGHSTERFGYHRFSRCLYCGRSRFASSAHTVSDLRMCPRKEFPLPEDSTAVAPDAREVLAVETVNLREAGSEAPAGAVDPRCPCRCTSDSKCPKEPGITVKAAAVAPAALPFPHRCDSSHGILGGSRGTFPACGDCTPTCSAALNDECLACREKQGFSLSVYGATRTNSGIRNSLKEHDTAMLLSDTTSDGASQRILSGVGLQGRQKKCADNWCPSCSECVLGHPQELELPFRPAVLRISLLRTRGSFRSFFKSSGYPARISAATSSTTEELQRQQAPPKPTSSQHWHRSMGVDPLFCLPDLMQSYTHDSQTTLTLSESPCAADCSGASIPIQAREWSATAARSATTVEIPDSHNVTRTSRKSTCASQRVLLTQRASILKAPHSWPSCGRCSACVASRGCGTPVEWPTHGKEENSNRRQSALHPAEARGPYDERCSPCSTQSADPNTCLGDHSSATTGEHTPSTASTCSSNANDVSGASLTVHACESCSSSSSDTTSNIPWRSSDVSSFVRQDRCVNQGGNSISTSSPVSVQRKDGMPVTGAGEVNVTVRSGYTPHSLASQLHQPHVCLLFLAANGTLFCSGDVPSVYSPRCVTSSDFPSYKACLGGSSNSTASAAASPSETCASRVPGTRGDHCEITPLLTTARSGTLYDAVWLPAVCAATHRPLLFGSLLASNTAAIALTSNLLLPRYKGRMPLHQRHLSCSILKEGVSTYTSSHQKQHDKTSVPVLVDSCRASCCGESVGSASCDRYTPVEDFAGSEESSVQWRQAAAAAGSGAAVAVLQSHTGEPVLLQQHRQDAQTAAASALWRAAPSALGESFKSSEFPGCHAEVSQGRHSQAATCIPSAGPERSAGFILRFLTLPDVRKCLPLRPNSSSSTSIWARSICCPAALNLQESRSVDGRSDALNKTNEEQAPCMAKADGSTGMSGIPPGAKRSWTVFRSGLNVDNFPSETFEQHCVTQNSTCGDIGTLRGLLQCSSANSERLQNIPRALSFLLDERWVACCLYKDLILLKTAGYTREKTGLSAFGLLVTNLEKELHDWLVCFFESHPQVLRSAKYIRLGFEKLTERCQKRCRNPVVRLSSALEPKKQRTQDTQEPAYAQHHSVKHEEQLHQHCHPQHSVPPYGECARGSQQQFGKSSHNRVQQQGKPEMYQQMQWYSQRGNAMTAARLHSGHQGTPAGSCDEERLKSKATSSLKARLSFLRNTSHAPVLPMDTHESSVQHGASNAERMYVGRSFVSGGVPGELSPRTGNGIVLPEALEKHLQWEEAGTPSAVGSSDAEDEVFSVEDADGDLRLFVNTAEGSFYCLNLQRRCLESAWPEGFLEVRNRQL